MTQGSFVALPAPLILLRIELEKVIREFLKGHVLELGLFEAQFFVQLIDPQFGQRVPGLLFRIAAELPDPFSLDRKIDVPFSVFEFEIPIIFLFDHRLSLLSKIEKAARPALQLRGTGRTPERWERAAPRSIII
jgi:hypothetical protein